MFNEILTSYCYVEDVNSWMRGTHEFHENWATANSNDSTVFHTFHVYGEWVTKTWMVCAIYDLYWGVNTWYSKFYSIFLRETIETLQVFRKNERKWHFSSKSNSNVGGSRFWEIESYGGVTIWNQMNSSERNLDFYFHFLWSIYQCLQNKVDWFASVVFCKDETKTNMKYLSERETFRREKSKDFQSFDCCM